MEMAKDELDYLPELALWVKTMRELETTLHSLYGLLAHAQDSPMSRAIGDVQSAYTAAVAELTGLPDQDVLAPFWLEQDLGKRPYKIKLKGDATMREITDASGLAKLAADWNNT